MDNYQFCAEWAAKAEGKNLRVLDYGCGAGQIVRRLRDAGLDAYGCDVFYEGGDYSPDVPSDIQERVRHMEGDLVPFPDAHFDLVVTNQVMEHVPDMAVVLSEIDRVLKPGGTVLSLFPDRGVWREGHCGIPFLHWFPKRSKARVYYAYVLRSLGAGYHKGTKSRMKWSEDFCEWLDNWTHYRSLSEIKARYGRHFSQAEFIEDQWLDKRVPRASFLPAPIKKIIVRKLGMLVFEARKAPV